MGFPGSWKKREKTENSHSNNKSSSDIWKTGMKKRKTKPWDVCSNDSEPPDHDSIVENACSAKSVSLNCSIRYYGTDYKAYLSILCKSVASKGW